MRMTETSDSPVPRPPPLWDPHLYTCRVKEAIHIRLHPKQINRDSGIEIPEAGMAMIKKHNNRRAAKKRTAKRTTHRNREDRNTPITAFNQRPL